MASMGCVNLIFLSKPLQLLNERAWSETPPLNVTQLARHKRWTKLYTLWPDFVSLRSSVIFYPSP